MSDEIPKVQITCVGLAIEASADMHCYAQNPDKSSSAQQWQLVYYPEVDAVAMLIELNNKTYALSAPPDEPYPSLRVFRWEDSYLWRVAPLGGNKGIPTVRDQGYCLTWEGGGGWKEGTKLQYYKWEDQENQRWNVSK